MKKKQKDVKEFIKLWKWAGEKIKSSHVGKQKMSKREQI